MATSVEIMDFAAGDIAPDFYVGMENHFVCVPDIPLGIMQQIAKFRTIKDTLEETGDMSVVFELFDQLLEEKSAVLFRARVADKTIGLGRIMRILPWIMEKYGLHPTQPSSPSLTGSHDGTTGTTSEDGQSPVESTSTDSE